MVREFSSEKAQCLCSWRSLLRFGNDGFCCCNRDSGSMTYLLFSFPFHLLSNLRWNKLQNAIPPEIGELKRLTLLSSLPDTIWIGKCTGGFYDEGNYTSPELCKVICSSFLFLFLSDFQQMGFYFFKFCYY